MFSLLISKAKFLSETLILFVEVIKSEIVDWWEDERSRVTSECRLTADAMQSRLEKQVNALGNVDLLSPRSDAYREIKGKYSVIWKF